MREKLKDIAGKRIKIFAVVQKFGSKKAFRGPPLATVCLVNLKDEKGKEICDHLWLTIRKQLQKLKLQEGDRISFHARSKPYLKGYRGRRDDVDRTISKDYTLKNPTNFTKLAAAKNTEETPTLFDN